MKTIIVKCLMLALCLESYGQCSKCAGKEKKPSTVQRKSVQLQKRLPIQKPRPISTPAKVDTAVVIAPPPIDSLPITVVKKSLRPETALDNRNH